MNWVSLAPIRRGELGCVEQASPNYVFGEILFEFSLSDCPSDHLHASFIHIVLEVYGMRPGIAEVVATRAVPTVCIEEGVFAARLSVHMSTVQAGIITRSNHLVFHGVNEHSHVALRRLVERLDFLLDVGELRPLMRQLLLAELDVLPLRFLDFVVELDELGFELKQQVFLKLLEVGLLNLEDILVLAAFVHKVAEGV